MSRSTRQPDAPEARLGNAELASLLRELAARLELDGVEHSPRAYRRAADTVERERRPVADLYAQEGVPGLDALPGVGEHIAETLRELLETGTSKRLERLRRTTGVDVTGLLAVEGIGPKRLKTLWEELRVRTVEDLEHAVEQKSIQGLHGFGARSEERLRESLRLRRRGPGRLPLARAEKIARRLCDALESHPDVRRVCVAGSIRRARSTVGDIDLVVASDDAPAVAKSFLENPEIAVVHAKGPHRVSVTLRSGADVDVRIVAPKSFGSALLYFTGSREHSVALRRLALAQGLRLNEYGLFRGDRRIAGKTEEEIYAALALPTIPPEARLGGNEIRVALRSTDGQAQ